MKSALLALSLLALPLFARAESTTYAVKGMHCGACVQALQAKVCKMDGLEKCEVSMGKILIVPKPGVQISQAQVQSKMTEVGEDYKITGAKSEK